MRYAQQKRYERTFEVLEEALRDWFKDNKYRCYLEDPAHEADEWYEGNYGFLAFKVLEEIDHTHSHLNSRSQRVLEYLQGLGLSVPHTYHDILEIAEADGRFIEGKSNPYYYYDTYFKSMAMRLQAIAKTYSIK